MHESKYRYLFGPVPSRRLGRSLGVDLVPRKTCSFNCLFCQVGPTTNLTLERKEYVPVNEVLAELESWLKNGGSADFITLSGSGEPTLHSKFGDVFKGVRKMCSIRTTLLSNGSLFFMPEVRSDAAKADIVKISLSVWDQTSFEEINRPHSELKFEKVLEGMRAFRSEYRGQLWLEVMGLFRFNATTGAMKKIAKLAESINPDRIHLNTVVRPPAEHCAIPVSIPALEKFESLFNPRAEVIAEFESDVSTDWRADEKAILAMIRRRPCTIEDVVRAFDLHPSEVQKHFDRLLAGGRICEDRYGEETYYAIWEEL